MRRGTRVSSRISTQDLDIPSSCHIKDETAFKTLLELRWDTKCHFLVSTEILGFLSIYKKSQASSAFEALKSKSLLRSQRM